MNDRSRTRRAVGKVALAACGLLLLVPGSGAQDPKDGWQNVEIPAAWKKLARGAYGRHEGFLWYRCAVTIPASWRGAELQLTAEGIDDAREFYWNGKKFGAMGVMPPDYRSSLGQSARLKIPADLVQPGENNLLAIRVFRSDGRGGFNVAPPVVMGPENGAVRLAGTWQVRVGDEPAWASGAIENSAIVFGNVEAADEVLRTLQKLPGEEGPLTPADSLAKFETAEDLRVELVLGDPNIGQPLSMKFDERGRLWVMQYLQYPDPAGLKMVSRDMHLRTVYDKIPPPPPGHFRGRDKISIHEDTDGDGKLDKHTIFVDGLNIASSFARGRGGVWVLNPPYLLFYPDRDGNDVPDSAPEVHLEGFGLEDSHSVVNSLRWGPDGWLYAAQGSTVTGNVKHFGVDEEPVHSMGQLIWRYHPETRKYEIFAEGGGNAFGVEIDSKGRVFSGHNGGNTRGFHYIQGGYFQKGFGKHGSLSNPYAFGYYAALPHHDVPRFTHTFVIYEGGQLPSHYHGKLFGVAPLQSHVVMSQFEPDLSSFRTSDLGHPLKSADTWFRPVDIQVGPDGAIYVADFYEQRIDHASHYQGRVHKTSGRIYRLTAADAQRPSPVGNLGGLPTEDLIELLRHDNKWYRQVALRLIGDRRDQQQLPRLRGIVESQSGQWALEALWALNLTGGLSTTAALSALEHDDPYVRLWSVRLLGDAGKVEPDVGKKLVDLAFREENVEVRSQLACSARRLSAEYGLPIAQNLLRHDQDAKDRYQPLSLWWLIEANAEESRDAVLTLLDEPQLWDSPIVKQHLLERIMRRYAQAGARRDLLTCAELLKRAPRQEHARLLMAGFEQAFQGRSLSGIPDELVAAINDVGGASLALRLRQGQQNAVDEALKVVADDRADLALRVRLMEVFADVSQPSCVSVLLKVLDTSSTAQARTAALGSLQAYDDGSIAPAVIGQLADAPDDVREAGLSLLVSRPKWTGELLSAVAEGQVAKSLVPKSAIDRMLLHGNAEIAQQVEGIWGKLQAESAAEMLAKVKRIGDVIATGSGNPYKGRELFLASCGKCHVLFDDGGRIGPNLTSYQRTDLNRMLLNVVNPSIEIREGFENYVLATEDGRTLNGFIEDQDNRVVVLKTANGQRIALPRDEIVQMKAVTQSVMPDGLLDSLNPQQLRNLFAYLRAAQPLP